MRKRIVLLGLIMAFCFCLPSGIWANERNIAETQHIIVNEKDNSITFISSDSSVGLSNRMNSLPAFVDVSDDAWYQMFVSHLAQLGVIHGTSPNYFSPNDNVTRAEFAKMITYAADVDLFSYSGDTVFIDVSSDAWYAPAVQWANENGIIMGKTSTTFCPNDNITREEAIAVVYRLAEVQHSRVIGLGDYQLTEDTKKTMTEEEISAITELTEFNKFNDISDLSEWSVKGVNILNTAGLICGDENGFFHPKNNMLRSEAAKVLSSYIIFNTTPTLHYDSGSSVEYLESYDESLDYEQIFDDLNVDKSVNPHGIGNLGSESINPNDQNDEATLSWAGYTHTGITEKGFDLTASSGRGYINTKMNETIVNNNMTRTGKFFVVYYAKATDDIENSNLFEGHFYDGSTGMSYTKSTTNNAYTNFNNHYYNALVGYRSNKFYGYKELGMACHYLEDLNAPHHGKNVIAPFGFHREYETWVNGQFNSFGVTQMTYESYRFMYDKSTKQIADGFSIAAKNSYDDCVSFYDVEYYARAATMANVFRSERAIAGFLNAYYYKAGLN